MAPVALLLEIDGQAEACFTRNISQGGMFVVTRRRAPEGATVKVALARNGQRLETLARVVNAAEDGLGLRYIDPDPSFGQGIAGLLAELLRDKSGEELAFLDGSAQAGVAWSYLPDGRTWNWWRKSVRPAGLLSLALDGAALECRQRPQIGETIIVFLSETKALDARLTCKADVVRHTDNGFAVKFTDPSIDFRRRISALRRRAPLADG